MAYAYALLASSPNFLLGARVVRQSLLDAGATYPMLLLHTGTVLEDPISRSELLSEGWMLQHVDRLQNPFNDNGEKQREVFSKLYIWNLTEFERVVYLDSDMLVQGVSFPEEELFQCGDFCAASSLRETEGRFNSGVMVVTPGSGIFQDMIKNSFSYKSYNGGDQGFLNDYIPMWCAIKDDAEKVANEKHAWASLALPMRWGATPSEGSSGKSLPLLSRRGNRNRRHCVELGSNWNHVAVVTQNECSGGCRIEDVQIAHYNHPVWWVMKPWFWVTFPFHASNWRWDRVRLTLPDQLRRALRARTMGIAGTTLVSVLFLLLRFNRPQHCGLRMRSSSRLMVILVRLVYGIVVGLMGVMLLWLVPRDLDAVSGWLVYTACRGCGLGSLSLVVLPQRGCPPRNCAWAVLGGYVLAFLETAFIFAPTLALGFYWVSGIEYYPLCMPSTLLETKIGCTPIALCTFVLPMLATSFAAWPLCIGSSGGGSSQVLALDASFKEI